MAASTPAIHERSPRCQGQNNGASIQQMIGSSEKTGTVSLERSSRGCSNVRNRENSVYAQLVLQPSDGSETSSGSGTRPEQR